MYVWVKNKKIMTPLFILLFIIGCCIGTVIGVYGAIFTEKLIKHYREKANRPAR